MDKKENFIKKICKELYAYTWDLVKQALVMKAVFRVKNVTQSVKKKKRKSRRAKPCFHTIANYRDYVKF